VNERFERSTRDELVESTPHGVVYLDQLVRLQLTLSIVALIVFAGLLGAVPLALRIIPSLSTTFVLGLPLWFALLGPPPFAVFVLIGVLYRRRADALDAEFRELVRAG
jgi:hypothetical protein